MTDQHRNQTAITEMSSAARKLPQLPLASKAANLCKQLEARLSASEAASLVVTMLRSYPETGKPDPAEYKDALVSALMQYPAEIAARCGSVDVGVITETTFKPTCADIHNWCKRESKWLFEMKAKYDRDAKERNDAAKEVSDEAIALARRGRENIAELRQRMGKNFGLKLVEPDRLIIDDAADCLKQP